MRRRNTRTMTKIAVTGAAGTIGKPLCTELARDHDVVRIDLHDADVIADIRELEPHVRAFAGCETVVHLAGIPSVTSSWDEVHGIDIGGTYVAFEAARRTGVKRVIFASSNHAVGQYEVDAGAALYEPAYGLVVGVGAPYRPDSLYGVWKAYGEALGRYYSDAFGLQVTCTRIGSITAADRPDDPSVADSSGWLDLTVEQKFKRYAATWMSQRDYARLVRAIMAHDVPFAIVYGVGDNATRFWDLEPGRALFGFWPLDGVRERG
ncbi:NAD-dependent epimerase [Vulcanimicrobium alpinum]|uniref:NAD-dependent epimerase n=2 Tax=Vulcanimicrobium alpinum TaxID=3016050 RepID=A0AAN1XT88_UNVUL|nr:NAD-dependent epimerase [Vulcanimicrobium alpinum]